MPIIEDFVAGRTPPQLYQAYLSPLFETWSDVLIEVAPPKGRALDLACGTGIVARKIAGHPGVESVLGVDIAGPMIAKAQAASEAWPKIEYLEASAERIARPDQSFNSVYCQQGLQFFPDKAAALNETARLMSSGAQAVFAIWTSADDGNPVFGAFEKIVAKALGDDLVPFGPFSFGERGEIERLCEMSQLELVSLEKTERLTSLPDPRTLVLFDLLFLGRPGPDGAMHPLFDPHDSAKDQQIEEMIGDLERATQSYQQHDGNLLAPTSAHILILRQP